MQRKTSYHQQLNHFAGSIMALVFGITGATLAMANSAVANSAVANPTTAQHPSQNTQPLQMAQSSSLVGSWRLVNMTAADLPTPMLPISSTELTAEFSGDRIAGSGGCNRFMGGYKLQDGNLNIGPLASTFMACEQAVMDQETKYLAALQAAQRYEIDDQGNLTIFYQTEQGSGVLRFVAQATKGLW